MPGEAPRLIAGSRPGLGPYDADIVILSLERPAETVAAIRSALGQRGGVFHVSVLDQNSSEATIQALVTEFAHAPRFTLYRTQRNLGVGGGRNFLSHCGHGRIIVGLDNDAVFHNPWTVSGALKIFLRRPELGALGFHRRRHGAGPRKLGLPAALAAEIPRQIRHHQLRRRRPCNPPRHLAGRGRL